MARILRIAAVFAWCALASCGADDSAATSADPYREDAGGGGSEIFSEAGTTGCTPLLPDAWMPTWTPPRMPTPHACTDTQISRRYTLCEDSVTRDEALCNAFQRDPANAVCQACIFSTEDESAYGAIVILRNGVNKVNSSGCIALLEGNLAADGCGAKHQSTFQCEESSCFDPCSGYESFTACEAAAASSTCKAFAGSECASKPAFTICGGYASYKEYFTIYSQLFCSTGFPDAGTGGDAGGSLDGSSE